MKGLLYSDRVSVAPAIERVRPVITKWESQHLKEREENEKACGFGSHELLPAWRETALGKEYLERISALCLEKDVHFSGCGCTKEEEDDVYEGASEQTEEGVVEEITRLLEKYTKAAQTKLDEAVSHFGATEKLQSIKDKWNLNATISLTRSDGLQTSGEETQPLVDPLCQASTENIGLGMMEQPIEVHSTIRRVRVDREEEKLTNVILLLSDGKPCDATSLKRKDPPQPSPASHGGSIGFGLDSSTTTKKSKGEWSCDVCKISTTSKNGLNEHLAGKKHQTKMAALKLPNNGGSEIGLGKVKSSVKEQSMEISVTPKENRETKGETTKKRFSPWCRICKVKTTRRQDMKKHRQGKQHLKKRFSRERAKNKNRLAGSKSIGA